MRLRISRHAEGLTASVGILRNNGRTEVLDLVPVGGDHHLLQSLAAPEEPHEFSAKLKLVAGNVNRVMPQAKDLRRSGRTTRLPTSIAAIRPSTNGSTAIPAASHGARPARPRGGAWARRAARPPAREAVHVGRAARRSA